MKRRIFVLGAIGFCFAVNGALAADVFSGNWKLETKPGQVEVRSGAAAEGTQLQQTRRDTRRTEIYQRWRQFGRQAHPQRVEREV